MRTATVEVADPGTVRRRLSGVYADPAAWLVAEAVAQAVGGGGVGGVAGDPVDVGVIGVSEHATRHTLALVGGAARHGRVSPMRFAAAGPGSLVGLVCAVFGYQGPTSMLTMPVEDAGPTVAALVADWLAGEPPAARHVVVAGYRITTGGRHLATCELISPEDTVNATTPRAGSPA